MDINYSYVKLRREFGRQPLFSETPVQMLDSIDSNPVEYKHYILRNPVQKEAQVSKNQSQAYINTIVATYTDTGIDHAEGGWPKDVNCLDEEAVLRHRRRNERDDGYVDAILGTYRRFKHYIDQNNAIDVYGMYYTDMPPVMPIEKPDVRFKNVYKVQDPRICPVASLSFTTEEDPKVVVAHCDKTFPSTGKILRTNFSCYIWGLDNPDSPILQLFPPVACWQLTCSSTDPNIILGGLEDGTVCLFDIRSKNEPVSKSPIHFAHRDPVRGALFIQSRLNTECFSGSTDGACMWWDIRNLSAPTDQMFMCVRVPPGRGIDASTAEGVTCLQFDRSFPTKFLCGTDTGMVINVNRKGKTLQETMSGVFEAHNGPVRAIHRSPVITKMFITCGDWKVNIWSDEVLISPILTGISQRHAITDVNWAPQRYSCYITVDTSGKLSFWDLLRKQYEPLLVLKVAKVPLLRVKVHDEGRLVATGGSDGTVNLLGVSESLAYSGDKDKQKMVQLYERETRREHILENRVKEIRLKQKADEEGITTIPAEPIDETDYIKEAEDIYMKTVNEEMRVLGVTATPLRKAKASKKR